MDIYNINTYLVIAMVNKEKTGATSIAVVPFNILPDKVFKILNDQNTDDLMCTSVKIKVGDLHSILVTASDSKVEGWQAIID